LASNDETMIGTLYWPNHTSNSRSIDSATAGGATVSVKTSCKDTNVHPVIGGDYSTKYAPRPTFTVSNRSSSVVTGCSQPKLALPCHLRRA
jgi:hypothetical protein